MDLRHIARWAGLVGGLLWVVRWVLDIAGTTGTTLDALHWGGLVLLALGLAGAGAALVSTSAPWLQAIVAVAFPALVWSVLEVLHPAASAEAVDGVFGLAVVVVFASVLVRSRPEEKPAPRARKAPEPKPGARRAGRGQRSTGSHAR